MTAPGIPDDGLARCGWAESSALMRDYHDQEWGRPEYDSRALWEKLMLDGFQAGLSWAVVLRKREALRLAFEGFHPEHVARYTEADIQRIVQDPGVIRSRSKIQATIGNAQAYLAMREAGEDFSEFVWSLAGGSPIVGDGLHIPTTTPLAQEMSTALKRRGFKFVGPVIVYAWMQATGLVSDHAAHCFCRTHHTP